MDSMTQFGSISHCEEALTHIVTCMSNTICQLKADYILLVPPSIDDKLPGPDAICCMLCCQLEANYHISASEHQTMTDSLQDRTHMNEGHHQYMANTLHQSKHIPTWHIPFSYLTDHAAVSDEGELLMLVTSPIYRIIVLPRQLGW